MHEEILTREQIELLPLMRRFNRTFYLVGGSAIALHLGHRRSIDFDLFSIQKPNRKEIQKRILANGYQIEKTFVASAEEYTIIINQVKMTFFHYPFEIPHPLKFKNIISLPSLLDLAAMKAYALGRRAKWKDYVDLFYLLKFHFSLSEISARASELFADLFSEKLFRVQLSYFDDIDYSEAIDYLVPPMNDLDIKKSLEEFALQEF